MKTIEEVRAFLLAHPFGKKASNKILGFLLGKGLIEKGEVVRFGEPTTECLTFDDFYEWFESEECPLCGLFNFLQDKQDEAIEDGDMETANKIAGYMGFLVEALDLEYEEVEDEDED